MTVLTRARRTARDLALLAALGLSGVAALAQPAAPASAEPGVQGLIVRLKDAPAHVATDPDLAARAEAVAARAEARLPRDEARSTAHAAQQREAARWRAVLQGAALAGNTSRRAPLLRPVGRDQQLLDFGQALGAAEAEALARQLRQRPEVDWVAPNVREARLQASTDPLSAQQWWLLPDGGSDGNSPADRRRGLPGILRAWQSGLMPPAGAGAVVAVLDTGITAHPDLAGRTLPGHDFVSDALFGNDGDGRDADPSDPGDWVSAEDRAQPRFAGCAESASSWHGTIVAGLLAAVADNGLGVAGLHPQGRVLPVRVAGKCGAAVADIVDGMRWAAGLPVAGAPPNPHPARIVNISFGGGAACGPEYRTAVAELRAAGVVVVAAAGNDHAGASRPANCPGVVGVVALNRDGFKTHYSNFGPDLADSGVATVGGDDDRGGLWRDLLADGGLVTVWNNGRQGPGRAEYAAIFGTSFAAPLVSGTMSLMLGVNPGLGVAQLIDGVRRTARPHVASPRIGSCGPDNPGRCLCTTASCGAGILDTEQALRFAAAPASYVPPPRQPALLDSAEVALAVARGPDRPANAAAAAPTSGGATGGAGGGALGVQWLLLLAAALALLLVLRRRRGRGFSGPERRA